MLKNEELKQLNHIKTLLNIIKDYSINEDTNDFYDKTGITILDLDRSIKALQQIHTTSMIKHKEHSDRANNWNKSHPEQHRKHSRDYERRKRK